MSILALRSKFAVRSLLVAAVLFLAPPASATVIFEWSVSTGSPSTGTMEITDAAFLAKSVGLADIVDFEFVSLATTFTEADLNLSPAVNIDIATDGSRFEGVSFFATVSGKTLRMFDTDANGLWDWIVTGEVGGGSGQWLQQVVPEPGTASLLVLGLAGLGLRRRVARG